MTKRKKIIIPVLIILSAVLIIATLGKRKATQEKIEEPPLVEMTFEELLKSGIPVLAEFGHNRCIPCRQMAPILEEITKEYKGKLIVKTIDVYEHNNLAMQYRIRLIPTQIFFDSRANESYRHEGFLEKYLIIQKLNEIGIK